MSSETAAERARQRNSFGKLYDLLHLHFPDHRNAQGALNIPKLAKDMGFAHETIYRAVRGRPDQGFPEGMLKVAVAEHIIRYSHENHPEQPIYWNDLIEFVLPHFEKFSDPLA